jgi:hypothetical protein
MASDADISSSLAARNATALFSSGWFFGPLFCHWKNRVIVPPPN